MSNDAGFTFVCTRCGKKSAVVKRGRKVFLCAGCASDAMWQDMVGAIVEGPEAPPKSVGFRQP